MDKKAFGSRLRQARKDRGLTSEKLSELQYQRDLPPAD